LTHKNWYEETSMVSVRAQISTQRNFVERGAARSVQRAPPPPPRLVSRFSTTVDLIISGRYVQTGTNNQHQQFTDRNHSRAILPPCHRIARLQRANDHTTRRDERTNVLQHHPSKTSTPQPRTTKTHDQASKPLKTQVVLREPL
ncbi:unnamed protein product, partial [Ectocarpus sp. 13 AM-2016]